MNIGIVCYASIGGSGVIASELGKTLALRGHDVHILSSDTPFRLADYQPGLSFHRVLTPTYPLFREPQYVLSLTQDFVSTVPPPRRIRFVESRSTCCLSPTRSCRWRAPSDSTSSMRTMR